MEAVRKRRIWFTALLAVYVAFTVTVIVLAQPETEQAKVEQASPTPTATPTPDPSLTVINLDEKLALRVFIENSFVIPKSRNALTPNRQLGLGIVYVLTISNHGKPTTVTGYRLSIKLPNKGEITARPTLAGGGIDISSPSKGKVSYPPTDDLSRKTAEQPIPTGGRATGYLLFVVEGATEEEVFAEGASLTIHYQDLWGEDYGIGIPQFPVRPVEEMDGYAPITDVPGVNPKITPAKRRREKKVGR